MPGFDDLLNQIGQIIGTIGGNLVSAVNTAGAVQHGGLQQMLAQQSALRDDPAFRQQVGQPGFLSALQGGMAGLGFPQIGPDPNVQHAGYGNQGQLIGPTARTNIPGLSPAAQAEQAHAIRVAGQESMTPEMAAAVAKQAHVGQAGGPTRMIVPTQMGNLTFGGASTGPGNVIPADWKLVHKEGLLFAQSPNGELKQLGTDKAAAGSDELPPWLAQYMGGGPQGEPAPTTTDQPPVVQVPQPSPGAVKIPLDDAAMGRVAAGFDQMVAAGQMTPQERDTALQTVRNDPATGDPTGGAQPAPPQAAPPQAAPAPAPAAPQAPLLPGHTAFGAITAPTWNDYMTAQPQEPQARIGYPSPAFTEGAAPAAPAPAAPVGGLVPSPVAPPGMKMPPPGVSFSFKPNAKTTVSVKGPPLGQRVPAISAREMSNMANASIAAEAAIQQIKAGPQHSLTIMGRDTGFKPEGLAGPAQGRALGALGKVSGQPLAVEEAQLRALIDHAKTGITAIFGQRLTKENRDFIDALLPDAAQPTNILLTHLQRLSTFYKQQTELREILQNLTPEQRQAFALTTFHQTMMDIPPPTTSTTQPDVIDLR